MDFSDMGASVLWPCQRTSLRRNGLKMRNRLTKIMTISLEVSVAAN